VTTITIDGYALTPAEVAAVRRHDIAKHQIRVHQPNYSTSTYSDRMKADGHLIMVNARPCKRCGLTVKTRAGHCTTCLPQGIAHLKRHVGAGYVYLAYSRSTGKVKVGATSDINERERSLRTQGYAGISDWRIIRHVQTRNAGEVEVAMRNDINPRGVEEISDGYRGDTAYAREVITVDAKEALEIWEQRIKSEVENA
jgi:hypothetical protein